MKLIHNIIFIQCIDIVCIGPRVRLILQFYCQISANISIMEYLRHICVSLSLKYTKYINGSTIIIDENSPLTPSDVRWTQPSFPITVTISQYRCKFFCTPRNHPTSEENVPRREINSMSRLKQSVEPGRVLAVAFVVVVVVATTWKYITFGGNVIAEYSGFLVRGAWFRDTISMQIPTDSILIPKMSCAGASPFGKSFVSPLTRNFHSGFVRMLMNRSLGFYGG